MESLVHSDLQSPDGKSQVELSESELEAAAMLLEKLFGIDAGAILEARLRSGTSLQGRARIVELAGRVRRHRLRRRELFPQPIFGEPPWEMLLALYLDFPDGTTVATLASRIALPGTTVRRWLGYLKDHHLVRTVRSGHDRRSLCVILTNGAREKLDRYFNDIELI
jgi:DNA-binding MarR family transcriptional regulator